MKDVDYLFGIFTEGDQTRLRQILSNFVVDSAFSESGWD